MSIYRIAVTGHRPDKLGGYDRDNPIRVDLRERFRDVLLCLIADAVTRGYCTPSDVEVDDGLAQGWDWDVAGVCARANVPYVGCVPFPAQASRWPKPTQKVYAEVLRHARRVEYVSKTDPCDDGEARRMLLNRNEYMVNRANVLVAAWNGDRTGGTAHCVRYARSVGKRIVVLVPGRMNAEGWLDDADLSCYFIEPSLPYPSLLT